MKRKAKRFVPAKGTLVALLLVSMLNCMGGAAVAPALPQISEAFPGSSEAMVALVISLPSLAVAISGFFIGVFADKVGKAKTLVFSLVLFTIAGLSGVFLPTLESILVSRFVMGVGMSGVATASTALIADYYDSEQQAKVLGMQSAATGASVLILEMTGGFLAMVGWRVPFYVYIIGIAMIVCVCLFVREPCREDENAAGINIDAVSSSSGNSIRSSAKSTDCEQKVEGGSVVIGLGIVLAFLVSSATFLVPSKMPYLIDMFGGNAAVSGLFLGAFGLANIVSALAYARLVRRFGRFVLLGAGFVLISLGMLCLALAEVIWAILPGVMLASLGAGYVLPLIANWIAWISTPQNSGRHMGMFAMMLNLGQFFNPIWAAGVIALTNSYSFVFMLAAIVSAVVAIAMFAMRVARPGLQNIHVS